MDIRLIALDMDGTLLNGQGVLSKKSKAALLSAMAEGVHVVICTGRVYCALPEDVLAVSGIEYAITSNGANLVRLADHKTLYSNLISGESVERIMGYLTDPTLMVEVFFDHSVYASLECLSNLEAYGISDERSKKYVLSTRQPVESIKKLLENSKSRLENINLIFLDQKKRGQVLAELSSLSDITVTSSMPYNLEIGGATTSKADALSHLCSLLAISKEEVMACGDSENDLAMLQFAGLSVAMGNAVAAVKAGADFVTGSNREDGVAEAIMQFVLKERGLYPR